MWDNETTQTQIKRKTPASYSHYVTKINQIAENFIESTSKWEMKKSEMIIQLKDTFLEMKSFGYYDEPESHICASICQVIENHGGNEQSAAYVRMVLESKYKDISKTTHDSIIKRALKLASETDPSKEISDINFFEAFKKEDFQDLTPSDIVLFKEKYLDVIKESKRRTKENKQLISNVIAGITKSQYEESKNKTESAVNMNETLQEILALLRNTIKNTKTINRFMNMVLDKIDSTPSREFEYNETLKEIKELASNVHDKTAQLVQHINKK